MRLLVCLLSIAISPTVLMAQEALHDIMRATVTLSLSTPGGTSTGSGFIVSEEGIIVTAAHVVAGASGGVVRMASGEEFLIEGTLAVDTRRDLALIRIAGFALPVATLAADDLPVGARIYAVGAPLGLEATVADGLLSAVRMVEGTRLLQISAPVSPGSSGGAVVNEEGQVVGVVVSGIRGGGAENLNFALPIEYVRGRMALSADQSPRPLGRVGAGDLSVPVRSAAPATLPVNEHLDLSTDLLHGMTYYTTRDEDGFNVAAQMRYAVVPIDLQLRKLEQIETVEYRAGDRLVALLERTAFVALDLSSAGVSQQLRVYDTAFRSQSASIEWIAEGGIARVDSSGVWVREFPARPGVIPSSLVGGVMAALDSLAVPSQLTFWTGEYDPLRGRFTEDYEVIDITQFWSMTALRPAQLGLPCGADTPTQPHSQPSVEVTWGGEFYYFRPEYPHYRIDPQTCVFVPSLDRGN